MTFILFVLYVASFFWFKTPHYRWIGLTLILAFARPTIPSSLASASLDSANK
jgi:hypothetical protein